MARSHTYEVSVRWTGNDGSGTSGYRAYSRDHVLSSAGKPSVPGSSDPSYRGDATRWNPEELLVASLSQCHMLWFLHLAAEAGVVVTDYHDEPTGVLREDDDALGGGEFTGVTLRPVVTVQDPDMIDRATALHAEANACCFIARSVKFPVEHRPVTR
jgi:organic hydroperoxide reductase OsmC/OhrA